METDMGKEIVICPRCTNGYYQGSECWHCKKSQEFQQIPAKETISKLLPPGDFEVYMSIYRGIKETFEAYPPKAPETDVVTNHLKSLKKNLRSGYLSHGEALSLQKDYMGKIGPRVLSPSTLLYFWLDMNKKGAQTDDFAVSLLISAIMFDLRLWYGFRADGKWRGLKRMNSLYGTRAALVSRFLEEEKIIDLIPEAVEGRTKRFKLNKVSPVLAICKYHLSTQSRSLVEDCPKGAIGFLTLLLPNL
jgi:hypothetical protein